MGPKTVHQRIITGKGAAMRCSALFDLEPDFGSEVKIEAWRRPLIQTAAVCAEGLPPAMLLWLNWIPVLSLARHKAELTQSVISKHCCRVPPRSPWSHISLIISTEFQYW